MERTRNRVELLRRRARRMAADTEGVLHRRELHARGVPRWLLQLEVRAGRWQRTGRQTVVTHNGALSSAARRVVAAYETGRRAALDGPTALQHLGATSLDGDQVHVIVPKGAVRRRLHGVRVHESRRFREEDVVVAGGVRVVRGAVAAVHGALWARTDRAATFLVVFAVQQGLATAADIADALTLVRRDPRRRLLNGVVLELMGGVRSMGELDVARALRERGLPEPDRQAVRRRASGTEYLDVRFERYGVVLEIDGTQHDELEHRVSDVLRDFAVAADGDVVLRLPLVVFRLERERVLDRLTDVLVSRGWRPTTAAS